MKTKPLSWIKEGDCIRCTSHAVNGMGYPAIQHDGTRMNISRIILEKRLGGLPRGIVARHVCDNRWCINPSHIIHGSQLDNIADRTIRGRSNKPLGSSNGRSKLKESNIRFIRNSKLSTKSLSQKFNVNPSTIWRAITNKTWRHV